MKRILLATALLGLSAIAGAAGFQLSSPDIRSGGTIDPSFEFDGFGCKGQNRSPALEWSGAPAGTRSVAITVYDPDAPTGSGWWHWSVIDLPRGPGALPANAGAVGGAGLPPGARQIRNDYGVPAWGGVCPPAGEGASLHLHRARAQSGAAGHPRRRHRGAGGLHDQRQHARQGLLPGHLRPAGCPMRDGSGQRQRRPAIGASACTSARTQSTNAAMPASAAR